jgi:hypothetical protein
MLLYQKRCMTFLSLCRRSLSLMAYALPSMLLWCLSFFFFLGLAERDHYKESVDCLYIVGEKETQKLTRSY